MFDRIRTRMPGFLGGPQGTNAALSLPTDATPATPATPAHAPSSVAPNASGVIGAAGSVSSVIGGAGGSVGGVGRRHGTLNPMGKTTTANPAANPTASAAAPAAEDRMDKFESVLSAIAAKVGVAMDEEEDPAAETEEEDPSAETEEENPSAETEDENKPAARSGAAGPASISQIEAACPGATSDFVTACLRAEMSVKQAKAFFAGQKAKIPARRGRVPLASGRSGAAAASQATGIESVQSAIDARAAEILREQGGKVSRIDAIGMAMNELKASDPAAFAAFRDHENARMQREKIGAAAATN